MPSGHSYLADITHSRVINISGFVGYCSDHESDSLIGMWCPEDIPSSPLMAAPPGSISQHTSTAVVFPVLESPHARQAATGPLSEKQRLWGSKKSRRKTLQLRIHELRSSRKKRRGYVSGKLHYCSATGFHYFRSLESKTKVLENDSHKWKCEPA